MELTKSESRKKTRISSTPLSVSVFGRGWSGAGSKDTNVSWNGAQGCRITAGTAPAQLHAVVQNKRLLRKGRRSRGSPRPALPDQWLRESKKIGPSAAPARPKPKAILKVRNHPGLVPLQSFSATAPGQRCLANSYKAEPQP